MNVTAPVLTFTTPKQFGPQMHMPRCASADAPKSAAVPGTDGTHRLLYCVESPESWFEDFGGAKLVRGRAYVPLDPQFAAVVTTTGYHVFLTAHGDSNGLYVARRSARGFEIRENQNGRNSLSFSYRIAARRRDVNAKRLATVTIPKAADEASKAPISLTPPPGASRPRSRSKRK